MGYYIKIETLDGSYVEGKDIEVTPDCECGEDFCDQCGDCLYCFSEDGCGGSDNVGHSWVIYLDDIKNPFRGG